MRFVEKDTFDQVNDDDYDMVQWTVDSDCTISCTRQKNIYLCEKTLGMKGKSKK